jgi:SAM-dependent methyltransferase
MNSYSKSGTGRSEDVLEYYSRNWAEVANCYVLDEQGLPTDPAWYRRRLYKDFLVRNKPATVLDVGCGGGWTVLDALEFGLDARGIEPVSELKDFGCNLLQQHGRDPDRIKQDDLSVCATLPADSLDCIAFLSVLPHVPRERWDDVHRNTARILRPGGRFIASYRNELFDLYTFNSFTIEFYHKSLWGCQPCIPLRTNRHLDMLKGLVTNPDVPGPYFTAAKDKSFGKLDRVKSNPLSMSSYLSQFGLQVEHRKYYHFHCVPPLLSDAIEDYRDINHQLELTMSDDWRGNFMAAIFMIEAVRI